MYEQNEDTFHYTKKAIIIGIIVGLAIGIYCAIQYLNSQELQVEYFTNETEKAESIIIDATLGENEEPKEEDLKEDFICNAVWRVQHYDNGTTIMDLDCEEEFEKENNKVLPISFTHYKSPESPYWIEPTPETTGL